MRLLRGWGRVRALVTAAAVLPVLAAAVPAAATPGAATPAAATPAAAPAATATPAAVAVATAAGLRAAAVVVDTTDGTTVVAAGEADALFPSESVVKVLVAARLLVEGGLTPDVEPQAAAMVTASDDDAASTLWGTVGGPDVVRWAVERYGLSGWAAPSEWGWWGNTKVSAAGVAATYRALLADPLVGPWLLARMAAATDVAADGTDQTFGLPRADAAAAVKQGWGGDDDAQVTANLWSTGYLTDGRFAVAVVVQDPTGGRATELAPTVDALAAGVVADARAANVVTAEDEARAAAAGGPPAAPRVGGASAPAADDGRVGGLALGLTAVLGVLVAGLSVARQRRATAPPS